MEDEIQGGVVKKKNATQIENEKHAAAREKMKADVLQRKIDAGHLNPDGSPLEVKPESNKIAPPVDEINPNDPSYSNAKLVEQKFGNINIEDAWPGIKLPNKKGEGGNSYMKNVGLGIINRYANNVFKLGGDGIETDVEGGVTMPEKRTALEDGNRILAEYQELGKEAFLNKRVETGLDLSYNPPSEIKGSAYDKNKPKGFDNLIKVLNMARTSLSSSRGIMSRYNKETLDEMGMQFADDEGNPGTITIGEIERRDLLPRQGDGTEITDERNEKGEIISKHSKREWNSAKLMRLGLIRAAQQDKKDILTHFFGGVDLRTLDNNNPGDGRSKDAIDWGGNFLPDREHTRNQIAEATEGMGDAEKRRYKATILNMFAEGYGVGAGGWGGSSGNPDYNDAGFNKQHMSKISEELFGADDKVLLDHYWKRYGKNFTKKYKDPYRDDAWSKNQAKDSKWSEMHAVGGGEKVEGGV